MVFNRRSKFFSPKRPPPSPSPRTTTMMGEISSTLTMLSPYRISSPHSFSFRSLSQLIPSNSASRVGEKPVGLSEALPLSIFGEVDKEEEGSGAVDPGFNGVTGSFSFPKKGGNLKGKGSDMNDLVAVLYKHNEKGKEGNWFELEVQYQKQKLELNIFPQHDHINTSFSPVED